MARLAHGLPLADVGVLAWDRFANGYLRQQAGFRERTQGMTIWNDAAGAPVWMAMLGFNIGTTDSSMMQRWSHGTDGAIAAVSWVRCFRQRRPCGAAADALESGAVFFVERVLKVDGPVRVGDTEMISKRSPGNGTKVG
jgi:hypothetical protein